MYSATIIKKLMVMPALPLLLADPCSFPYCYEGKECDFTEEKIHHTCGNHVMNIGDIITHKGDD